MTLIVRKQNAEEYLDEIRQRGDPNFIDQFGLPPLCVAIYQFRSKSLVKELLKDGADVNRYTSPKGQIYQNVRLWYKRWGNFAPLHFAVTFGLPQIVKLLLENGADSNARTTKGIQPPEILVSTYKRCLLVSETSEDADLEILKLLVSAGSDVNVKDESKSEATLLHQAILLNRNKIAKYLIFLGCDVNAIDTNGRTPLHYSAMEGIDCGKCLLENGANPNAQDNSGDTAYHLIMSTVKVAETDRLLEYVKQLHKFNVNSSIRNNDGKTIFHLIFKSHWFKEAINLVRELVKLAVQNGADPDISDKLHRMPVFYLFPQCPFIGNSNKCESILSILNILMRRGMTVNKRDITGQPLFHVLTRTCLIFPGESFFSCVMNLLGRDHDFDVNIRDFQNRTALHLIASKGNWQLADILLKRGADINALDCDGNSSLHVAISCKQMGFAREMFLWMSPERAEYNLKEVHCYCKSNRGNKILLRSKSVPAEKNNYRKLPTPLGSQFQWTSASLPVIIQYLVHENALFFETTKSQPTFSDIRFSPNPTIRGDFLQRINASSLQQTCEENSVGNFHLNGNCNEEKCAIAKQVFRFVKDLVEKCAEMDSRLQSNLLLTGSTAEGTKMWKPDEFDFLVELSRLRDRCKTEGVLTSLDITLTEDNLLWSDLLLGDQSSVLSPAKLKNYLTGLLWKGVLSLDRSRYPNIWYNLCQYNAKADYFIRRTKVGVNLSLYWSSKVFKNLKISVDLTPAIPLRLTEHHKSMSRDHAISKCNRGVFHVVPYIALKHNGSERWRTSFSFLEFEMIKTFSSRQISLYKCLKFLRDIYDGTIASIPSYHLKMFLFNFFFLDEFSVQRRFLDGQSFDTTLCHVLRSLSHMAVYPLDRQNVRHFFLKYSLDMSNYDLRWCKETLDLL